MTLRVGVVATPYGEHSIEFIRQAEQLGVDSIWVPEFWAGDALTPLGFLAARTSNIRLATGIVQLGRDRKALRDVGIRAVKRSVEASYLRQVRQHGGSGANRGQVVRLVQRRERNEFLE